MIFSTATMNNPGGYSNNASAVDLQRKMRTTVSATNRSSANRRKFLKNSQTKYSQKRSHNTRRWVSAPGHFSLSLETMEKIMSPRFWHDCQHPQLFPKMSSSATLNNSSSSTIDPNSTDLKLALCAIKWSMESKELFLRAPSKITTKPNKGKIHMVGVVLPIRILDRILCMDCSLIVEVRPQKTFLIRQTHPTIILLRTKSTTQRPSINASHLLETPT